MPTPKSKINPIILIPIFSKTPTTNLIKNIPIKPIITCPSLQIFSKAVEVSTKSKTKDLSIAKNSDNFKTG